MRELTRLEGRLPQASPGVAVDERSSEVSPKRRTLVAVGPEVAVWGAQRSDGERSETERSGVPHTAGRGVTPCARAKLRGLMLRSLFVLGS